MTTRGARGQPRKRQFHLRWPRGPPPMTVRIGFTNKEMKMPKKDDVFSVAVTMRNETAGKDYQLFQQLNLAAIDANMVTTAISHSLSMLGFEQAKEMGADPAKLAAFAEMLGLGR